ncbi:5-methylcytosine restriction system specificity protein McrC [Microbacterium sp. OR16]|uniref:5-methylcytosine restriction system specificity protein McrC n=1 Tax=Microbacterium sp. OR16 TaxID=3095345 RepID=UPI0039B5DBCC
MKTLRLAEARTATHALTDDQAGRLALLGKKLAGERRWWGNSGAHSDDSRSVFRLTKLFGGSWRVEVGNVVGVVGLPDLTIIVEPKIGMQHFMHLLARSNGMPRVDSSMTSLEGALGLQRVIIEWFVGELDDLFRRGLVKDYVHSSARLPVVRGHVDLVTTSRQWLQGRVLVDCEFDDFTETTPFNQLLAAAVSQSIRSPAVDDRLRMRLAYFARELPPASSQARDVDLERLPARYRPYKPALKYAMDLLTGVGRSLESGDHASGTFLFNSAAVAEDAIREVLAEALAPMRVVKTGGRRLLPAFVSVNPDLEIGPPPFTGDVKYKIGDRSWNRQDLAQAVLFAAAYKSPHAVIADFAQMEVLHPSLKVGDIQVSRLRWAIGDGTDPEDSERRFAESARAHIEQSAPNLLARL